MTRQKRSSSPRARKKSDSLPVLQVGIIFVVDNRILIESTQASKGEAYGDFLNHANGHEAFWAQLQTEGLVPQAEDYITAPRGRSVVNRVTGRPILYLDRCIIKKPDIVREIKRRLQLPARVEIFTDSHYRCPVCLSRSSL